MRRLFRASLLLTGAALLAAGACAPPTSHSGANVRVVEELRQMAAADQASRTPPNEMDPAADEKRQNRVLELLAVGEIGDAESQENAALILQHSALTVANGKLAAVSLDNFLLAHLLAKAAVEHGRDSARGLAAAALDRYLVFSGKPQKYGTQTIMDFKSGKMVVPPIDPATTDAERAEWHIEPKAQFLKHAKGQGP